MLGQQTGLRPRLRPRPSLVELVRAGASSHARAPAPPAPAPATAPAAPPHGAASDLMSTTATGELDGDRAAAQPGLAAEQQLAVHLPLPPETPAAAADDASASPPGAGASSSPLPPPPPPTSPPTSPPPAPAPLPATTVASLPLPTSALHELPSSPASHAASHPETPLAMPPVKLPARNRPSMHHPLLLLLVSPSPAAPTANQTLTLPRPHRKLPPTASTRTNMLVSAAKANTACCLLRC